MSEFCDDDCIEEACRIFRIIDRKRTFYNGELYILMLLCEICRTQCPEMIAISIG